MDIDDSMIPLERIENKILLLRGKKVLLDRDLAELYGVETRRLKEQVKRNIERFPNDFMLQVTDSEVESMVSQNAIPSKQILGGALPFAFTQEGVAMLSSVLRSSQAITMNIQIMRAFVRMREMIANNEKMAGQLNDLEERMDTQEMNTILLMDKLRNIEDKVSKPTTLKSDKNKIGFRSK